MTPLGKQLDDKMQQRIFGEINKKLYAISAQTRLRLDRSLFRTIERKLYMQIYWIVDGDLLQEIRNL